MTHRQILSLPKNFAAAEFKSYSAKAAEAAKKLLAALPQSFSVASESVDEIKKVAEKFRAYKNVLILGTGGSSLGGKTLSALSDNPFAPKMHFIDNVDPHTFAALTKHFNPKETGVIAISKSGSTAETLCQLHALLPWLNKNALLILTEAGQNSLRALGESLGAQILPHHPQIGGRFSVLSNVGLLPAAIAGVDIAAVRAGAADMLKQTDMAAEGAAMAVALNRHHGVSQNILMPYCDRLRVFAAWQAQLWAESLGKNGKGMTPIAALGTVDQHSQLQLYLDGPADKSFTLIALDTEGEGARIAPPKDKDARLDYLYGRTMGDLLAAEAQATLQSLKNKNLPVRLLQLEQLDARAMGGLLMQFMLETVLAADLLGVNPYDQPAVEEGKVLTRQYLSAKAG